MFVPSQLMKRAPHRAGFGAQICAAAQVRDLPFVLSTASRDGAAAFAGEGRAVEIARFASLPAAMGGALAIAEGSDLSAPAQVLAILDRENRLVLAGVMDAGLLAWCHPVLSAPEARRVVIEASQMRAEASRALAWKEPGLARRLRHGADLLEARLVDPLWRQFAVRALHLAA